MQRPRSGLDIGLDNMTMVNGWSGPAVPLHRTRCVCRHVARHSPSTMRCRHELDGLLRTGSAIKKNQCRASTRTSRGYKEGPGSFFCSICKMGMWVGLQKNPVVLEGFVACRELAGWRECFFCMAEAGKGQRGRHEVG